MKQLSFSILSCAVAMLVAGPLLARADIKPSFDDDAKPILSQQPGLIEYVESKYQVKDTGIAKYPGDDDHAPVPPYIFRARARGSNGPYNLRLLIQPGAPGHILGIVQDSSAAPQQPAVAKAPASAPAKSAAQTAQASSQQQQTPEITADTPSGPIGAATNNPAPMAPSSNSPGLAPPPDPAPQPK